MSVVKEYGKCIPVCDICYEALPAEDTFEDAIAAQKAAGWKNVEIEGEWHSKCADCINEGL